MTNHTGGEMNRVPTTLAALLFAAALSLAAPPVPSETELKAAVGKPALLTVKVEAGKKLGTEKTFDPKAVMVARLWSDDPTTFEFWVIPNEPGTFYLPFWTEGETKGVTVKVVAGGAVVDPGKPPVTPTPADVFYFAVVTADQATRDVSDAMLLPAWDEVKAKGHTVKHIPVSELSPGLSRPASLPTLMILKKTAEGKWQDTQQNKPMPTTNDAIRSLIK